MIDSLVCNKRKLFMLKTWPIILHDLHVFYVLRLTGVRERSSESGYKPCLGTLDYILSKLAKKIGHGRMLMKWAIFFILQQLKY